MPNFSLRSSLSAGLIRAASALRFSQRLQNWPFVYGPLRALLRLIVGSGEKARRIQRGPLAGWVLVLSQGDRNAYLVNEHETSIVNLATSLCRPGMNVLDIGAHVGYFSLLFSSLVGSGGSVRTFEPNPANVRKIRGTIAANRIKNVFVYPYAASNADGPVLFEIEATGQMGHIVEAVARVSPTAVNASSMPDSTVKVRAVSIDAIARQESFGRIDLIKMDVEGAEKKALQGLKDTLRSDGPVIICEWHPRVAGIEFEDFFGELGYRVEVLELTSGSEPFHLVARSKSGAEK